MACASFKNGLQIALPNAGRNFTEIFSAHILPVHKNSSNKKHATSKGVKYERYIYVFFLILPAAMKSALTDKNYIGTK
jgi:hypothetical protein